MAINNQLKKGLIEILLLKLLEEGEMYGYEMIKTLDSRTSGFFRLKEGTLYPVLYRLEDSGSIISDQKVSQRGKGKTLRKYYSLTDKGRQTLKEYLAEWTTLCLHADNIFKGAGK